MRKFQIYCYAVGLLFISVLACGEEGALYAEGAPPGSAFVRVFNGSASGALSSINLGGKVLPKVPPFNASAYVYLPPGQHTVSINDKQQPLDMGAGEFYTVINNGDGSLTVIKDVSFNNRRKALVMFYNLLPDQQALDLTIAEKDIAVVEDVSYMNNKSREVNPLKITLAASADGKPLGQANTINFRRGYAFSLFACGESDNPKLVWVESAVDTTL
jgi:alginate O-acetyltransferase complex protein AlgF